MPYKNINTVAVTYTGWLDFSALSQTLSPGVSLTDTSDWGEERRLCGWRSDGPWACAGPVPTSTQSEREGPLKQKHGSQSAGVSISQQSGCRLGQDF